MAVKLRLSRAGAKKSPYYRVVAADSRSPRDGRFIEQIGVFDPTRDPEEIRFQDDRVAHWISKGATASQTVSELLVRAQKRAKGAVPPSPKAKPAKSAAKPAAKSA